MTVTAGEFRTHMATYFHKLADEDIYITRHGKTIAVLTSPHRKKVKITDETTEAYMNLTQRHMKEMIELLKGS